MADGVDIDLAGQPWIITFHSGAGTALPATIWDNPNAATTAIKQPGDPRPIYPFRPKRIIWIAGTGAAAGDSIVLKDIPSTGSARVICQFIATGADYEPPQEWKAGDKEAYYEGLQATTFAVGTIYIHI